MSARAYAQTPSGPPEAPFDFRATFFDTDGNFTLKWLRDWNDPTIHVVIYSPDYCGCNIDTGPDGQFGNSGSGTYDIHGVWGQKYSFIAYAYNAFGSSEWTDWIFA